MYHQNPKTDGLELRRGLEFFRRLVQQKDGANRAHAVGDHVSSLIQPRGFLRCSDQLERVY